MRITALQPFLLILLIAFPASAQISEREKAQQELEKKQELERRITGMLDEIATSAWSLKLPENRVFVMSNVADLLWTRDQKRARSTFWDAINTINLLPGPAALEVNAKPSAAEQKKAQQLYVRVLVLRKTVLLRVAKRDPQLALELLRATRKPPLDPRYTEYRVPDDQDLEQEIATEAAARDPKRALQLARETLARGFSYKLQNLLFQLNAMDRELASQLAGEMVDKIQSRDLASDNPAGSLAVDLLELSRLSPESWLPASPYGLKLTDEQKRLLVERLVDAALAPSSSPNLVSSLLPSVMPEIEQFAPDRLAIIQTKLAAFTQTLNPQQRDRNKYHSLFHSGDAEEMIRVGNKMPEREREMFFRQAVTIAALRGKTDSLREVINKEVDSESQRKGLLESLDSEEIAWASNRGRTEELQKLLPKIRLKEDRARTMAEIAVLLEKKGEHEQALKLLEEARGLIKTDVTSPTQSYALFSFVFAYALIDPPQAFIIVERVIDRANDQISKLLLLDKVISSGAVKKGEIILEQPGMMPSEFIVFKYGRGIEALANVDFNRTKAAADRFGRNELRLMAKLLIAQSLSRTTEEAETERKDPQGVR